MRAAATPKGTRRRARLIAAAGELFLEGGFDAVRHRAVADRAQLPLASTTYYFASLEDLVAEAVASACANDCDAIIERGRGLTRRRRGAEATAEVLADVFIGEDTSRERLTCRFESVVLSARVPRLQQVLIDHRNTLRNTHFEVLEKSGRSTDPSGIEQLMAVEDGVVIGALADSVEDVVKVTRTALSEVIDQLAPVAAV
ncbi:MULTISPECIES: TetR/AcrR family transcriptional regulator [Williamsia]|uniref:TetR/AcrR family transcriptional regulator n=1 Tax=Williamsia TaxID=85043 RepID=UPI000A01B51A|nr:MULTISPECIES: TetR family transcriptional regulator [Williamsia]MCK0517196.1 TetR family transcriptional regulator [Williamsia sp. DF01-3]